MSTSIGTVTYVSIKFSKTAERKQKDGYKYRKMKMADGKRG